MEKKVGFKVIFWRFLLVLPLLYIALAWGLGLRKNYLLKPALLGPYEVEIGADINEEHAHWSIMGDDFKKQVLDPQNKKDFLRLFGPDKVQEYIFKKAKYMFLYPGVRFIEFPRKDSQFGDGNYKLTLFPIRGGGWPSVHDPITKEDMEMFSSDLMIIEIAEKNNRPQDAQKIRSFGLAAAPIRKFRHWFGTGDPFSGTPKWPGKDYLGMVGLFIWICMWWIRDIRVWFYYLYWVVAIYFARVGFYIPVMGFKKEGWLAMFYNFPDFIFEEGRWFLWFAVGISIPVMIVWGFVYLTKHVLPRKQREVEDFFKMDKDREKRKELSVESVEFKKVKFDMKKKLDFYKKRDQYFLGVDDAGKDILIDENMVNYHTHILGPTGSGKTAMAILPLSKQAINKGRGCCFIDFKGDDVFRKCVQYEAQEAGKKFYYFSFDPDEESAGYNPLFSGDIHSKVDRIMSALELIYQGAAGFYSNVQSMTFIELLKEMVKENRETTFRSVKEVLEDPEFLARVRVSSQEVKGLLAAISRFSDIESINKQQIDLAEVIKNGDMVFFALKSQVNTQLAEAIGRMLIIDIKSQARTRKETDPPYFIFIDEFQNLACTHFVDVISKVRSANFALVLSNQSRGNLSSVSPAFENAIFTNTATKIIFSQEDPEDAKFWSSKTGQTTYQDKSTLQFDGFGVDGEKTMLDGRRSSQGSIHTAKKNYITENVFLRLPFSKSVIFARGQLARVGNHEFLFDKAERDRMLSLPFGYNNPQGVNDEELISVAGKQKG